MKVFPLFRLSGLGAPDTLPDGDAAKNARVAQKGAALAEKIMGGRMILAGVLGVCLAVGAASGAAYNFANFTDISGTRPFSFTNNGGASGIISTTSVPINFNFTAPTGLSTAGRPATLTISGSTLTPAVVVGTAIDQPITTSTLSITENSTGKDLLSMTFTGAIIGASGGPNAQLAGADTSGTVTFTSDYLTFTPPGNSYALSLAAMSPTLSIGPGSFLSTFAADITGQFTANAIPEPLTLGLFALAPLALLRRR
jgi:hypothetical protein